MRTKDSRTVLRGLECGNALRLPGELDQTLELPLVLTAMQRALELTVPLFCNSDQGSHFTSPQYCQLLLDAKVQISMDGKGQALDNFFTERLWRTVKYEEVNIHEYTSPREARQALTRYFEFYNQELDYQTPADVYFHTASGDEEQLLAVKNDRALAESALRRVSCG